MDYNFDIIYKQGKMNTNADALSRIKINMTHLKSLIPKDISVLTRNMLKERKFVKNNTEHVNNPVTSKEKLYIWDSTSISDIRNLKRIKFKKIINEKVKDNRRIKIKMPDMIRIDHKNIIVEYSDNSSFNLTKVLEKLIQTTTLNEINELALSYDDEIFKNINTNDFKDIDDDWKNAENVCKIYLFCFCLNKIFENLDA